MVRSNFLVLLAVLILALLLRLVGLNWDDHSHLHPDERFLTGMASDIGEAESLTTSTRERCHGSGKYDYFNTSCSVFNPNNVADGSYAYGTLPLFIVRITAQLVADYADDDAWLTYDYIHFIGRAVNAAADMLTTLLVFLIGMRLFSVRHGLIAAFFYACAVLPIQLSHFWTVDILSNLFFVIALYALVEISKNGRPWWYMLFGVALGSAVASRINIAPAALLLPIAAFLHLQKLRLARRGWLLRASAAVILISLAGILAFLTFRVFQPYAFVGPTFSDWGDLNDKWLEDVTYVSNLSSRADDGWPPSNQWFGRIKYLYPWWNLVTWGLGSPLGLTATFALGAALYLQIRNKRLSPLVGLFTLWILVYFGWQGGLHQMTMRYYLPLYGMLCVMAAWALLWLNWPLRKYITAGVLFSTLVWAFAFTRIYRHPLTRLEASEWIVDNFPATLTFIDKNGNRTPAALLADALQYPLTTVTNGETYISEGFELNDFIRLTSFEMTFPDAVPSIVNLRLLHEDDVFAENPIALFSLETETSGHYEFSPGEIPDLPAGIYHWHFDVTWDGEQPFRYVMPTYQWRDAEDNLNHSPMKFLSPYPPVEYASLGHTLEFRLSADQEVTGFLFPHVIGQPASLILKAGETEVTARPVESQHEKNILGAQWEYILDEPITLTTREVNTLRAAQPMYVTGTVIATEGPWDDHVPWGICRKENPQKYLVRFITDCDRYDPFAVGYFPWLEMNMAETDGLLKNLLMLDVLFKADYLTISSNRFYDALPRYPVNGSPPRIPSRFVMSRQYYKDLFSGKLNYKIIRRFERFPGFAGLEFRDQVLPDENLPPWMNELEAEEAYTVYDHPTVYIFKNEGFAIQKFSSRLLYEDDRNQIKLSDYDSTYAPPEAAATNRDVRNTSILWMIGFWVLGWLAYPMMYLLFPSLPLRGFAVGRGAAWLLLAFVPWWLTAATGLGLWARPALWMFVLLFGGANLYLAYQNRAKLRSYLVQNYRAILAVELLFIAALAFGIYLRGINPDLWHLERGGEKPMDFAYLNATLRTSDFPPPNPWLAGYEINYYYFGFVLAALPIKLGNFAPEIGVNLVLPVLFAVTTTNLFTLAYALLGYAEKILPRVRLTAALFGTSFIMLAGNLGTLKLMIDPEENMHPHRWYWFPTRIIAESANRTRNGGPITEVPLFSFLFGDPHAHLYTLLPVTLYLIILFLLVTQRKLWLGLLVGMLSGIIFMSNVWDILLYVPLGALMMWLAAGNPRRFVPLAMLVAVGGIVTITPYYLDFVVGANRGIERWQAESSLFEPFMLTWGIPIGVVAVWLLYRLKAVLVPDADTPVELGLVLLAGGFLYFVGSDLEKASILCAMLALAGLLLIRFDDRRLRPVHFFSSLIFAILLATEHYVIKGDVGRLNTVFKFAFQLWLWLGLLMTAILYIMWTSYRQRIQVIACIILMLLGFLYPIKAIPGRKADSETGNFTLDGYEFTHSLSFNQNGWKIRTWRDNELTRYMRANIDGFPVIAEWYTVEYTWNSRVSVQTGLPSVVGWANHMRQQYEHLHPVIEERISDMLTFYTTDSIDEVRGIIRKYNIEYIVVGTLEHSITTPETLNLFYQMRNNGELSLVYDAPYTELFKVETLPEIGDL